VKFMGPSKKVTTHRTATLTTLFRAPFLTP